MSRTAAFGELAASEEPRLGGCGLIAAVRRSDGVKWSGLAMLSLVLPVALIVAGCDAGPVEPSTGVTSTESVAVTAPNPTHKTYDELKKLETRSLDRIPQAMRVRYPWAFDSNTGRLVDFDQALTRARADGGCAANCVDAAYTEILLAAIKTGSNGH